jgi:hypothetical protein
MSVGGPASLVVRTGIGILAVVVLRWHRGWQGSARGPRKPSMCTALQPVIGLVLTELPRRADQPVHMIVDAEQRQCFWAGAPVAEAEVLGALVAYLAMYRAACSGVSFPVWAAVDGLGVGRDEEAVGSNPATPTQIKICPLWSGQYRR